MNHSFFPDNFVSFRSRGSSVENFNSNILSVDLFSRDYATCDNNDKNDDRQPTDFEKKSLKKKILRIWLTAEFIFHYSLIRGPCFRKA